MKFKSKLMEMKTVLFLINSAIQYIILSFAVLAVQWKGRLAWDTSPSSTRISARDP